MFFPAENGSINKEVRRGPKCFYQHKFFSPRASESTENNFRVLSWRCDRRDRRLQSCAGLQHLPCRMQVDHETTRSAEIIWPGEVIFAVMSKNSTREPHRLIAASVGLALPADKSAYGYLSEHHSFGQTDEEAGDYAEELAAEMLATTLNVEFDPIRAGTKKKIYRISNKIVRTLNITQSAVGDKRGWWTTVISAAILLGD